MKQGGRRRFLRIGFGRVRMVLMVAIGTTSAFGGSVDKGLVIHFPLQVDTRGAHGAAATTHGTIHFSKTGGIDAATAAARFGGRDAFIEVPSRKWGRQDFAIALWVNVDADADMPGDLINQYDATRRKGVVLSLVTRTGVTHSQANVRQLHFGIDDGKGDPQWIGRGRPGNAVYIHALATHDGAMFAGTCESGAKESGRVHRYAGGDSWIDCGAPDQSNAVVSLATFDGQLYAGTGKYRLAGSSLPESANPNRGGRICRYDGGRRWTVVGEFPDTEAVGGLVVFQNRLYASSLYRPAGFFRYEADGRWLRCPLPAVDKRVESLAVFNGSLYATSYDNGNVYRFDGTTWTDTGPVGANTQTYGFAVYRGELYVSSWPSGRVYRMVAGSSWQDVGRLGAELEVMGMAVYNGKLFAGTLPHAQVYRFDEKSNWTLTGQLDHTASVKYRRAWSMAEFNGELFVGTLPSGRVHSLKTGQCTSYDREFPQGWHHVVAVRRAGQLELHLDGALVARSSGVAAPMDIGNDSPMQIGYGPHDYFHGQLRDVRIYERALEVSEIQRLKRD